jgi:hypothetical protein
MSQDDGPVIAVPSEKCGRMVTPRTRLSRLQNTTQPSISYV